MISVPAIHRLTKEHLDNWFTYHSPTPEQLPQFQDDRLRQAFTGITDRQNSPASADQTADRCLTCETIADLI